MTGDVQYINGVPTVVPTVETFSARLKATVQQAILHGVYAAIVLIIVAFALSWTAGDYFVTKQRAQNGQAAFEAIQRASQPQQAAKPAPEQP